VTRRRKLQLLGLAALLPVLGLAVAASGVIPIEASSGHVAPVQWFLEFSKRRSVATHSRSVGPVRLTEPWFVLKGAGHYHAACLPCHGGPERGAFQHVAQGMSPPPPDPRHVAGSWDAAELFYVVKHGIKFTGMPAWPTQERDDEVRAVVAFLKALPGLDREGYRRLVHGDVAPVVTTGIAARAQALCARCHGADGLGRGSAAFPALAGQPAGYLSGALRAYASGARHSGMMAVVARALEPGELEALAEHYAGLPGRRGTTPGETASVERGRLLASAGDPARRVPSCVDCHGPGPGRDPAYPELAGQYEDYLVLQLELFAADRRGGSAHGHLMSHVAPRLTPEQRRDVARWYASRRSEAQAR